MPETFFWKLSGKPDLAGFKCFGGLVLSGWFAAVETVAQPQLGVPPISSDGAYGTLEAFAAFFD